MNIENRLKILQDFLKKEPNEPFNHYGIALEYLKMDKTKAVTKFKEILERFPEYVPTYYHAAALFEEIDEIELSKSTYEVGIETAKRAGDSHALRELSNAYQNFLFENDLL